MIDNKVMTLQVCNVCKLHHHQSRISSHTCVYLGNTPLTLAIKYSNKTKKKKIELIVTCSGVRYPERIQCCSPPNKPSHLLRCPRTRIAEGGATIPETWCILDASTPASSNLLATRHQSETVGLRGGSLSHPGYSSFLLRS